jgi:hypothetical protein
VDTKVLTAFWNYDFRDEQKAVDVCI